MPRFCQTSDCKKRARYALPSNMVCTSCFEHKTAEMIDPCISKCQEKGCIKYPSFNLPGAKKRLYCSTHKKDGMVIIGCKPCAQPGCRKIPAYNYEGQSCGLYCNSHKKDSMINVVSPICIEHGCKTRAHFGTKEKTNMYCSKHKKSEMISSNETCKESGCHISPTYSFKDSNKRLYCSKHKKEGMVAMVNICVESGCSTRANYNFPGNLKRYCSVHKKEGMINVGRRYCSHDKCTKTPCYNYSNETLPIVCAEHKKDDMINLIIRNCSHIGCRKYPVFNYLNEKKGVYCREHKKEEMIDVVHTYCKTPLCFTRVIPKYKGYCLYCFIQVFPDEPITRNYKTKEKTVTDFVKSSITGVTIKCDRIVEGGTSKKRPDMLINLESHAIVVEVDEHQHSDYNCTCENKRIMEISKDVDHKPIVFIRFNPDGYKDSENKSHPSCWHALKTGILSVPRQRKLEWDNRLNVLKNQINYWIENAPGKTVELVHLFYDSLVCGK